MLQAIILIEDNETSFPFAPGQIVTVPLVVARVKKSSPMIDPKNTWQALLVPSGDKVGGLIVTNVEPAEE